MIVVAWGVLLAQLDGLVGHVVPGVDVGHGLDLVVLGVAAGVAAAAAAADGQGLERRQVARGDVRQGERRRGLQRRSYS